MIVPQVMAEPACAGPQPFEGTVVAASGSVRGVGLPIPLVATKFAIPRTGGRLLRRPRLLEPLNEYRGHRMVLVVGPPGMGKTVLLTQWLGEPGAPPHAWLSLDAGDNDPGRFWAHLLEALNRLRAEVGERGARRPAVRKNGRVDGLMTALADDLAHIETHCVLVLEDLHAVTASAVVDGLGELIEHLSGGLCIAISSRSHPRLPLERLRVRDELIEIVADDLRFNLPETEALFATLRGLDLDHDDLSLLHERTEGWAAGLQLAALSLRRRGRGADFIRGFRASGRMIADYLLAEVLERQTSEVRDFLLTTAVLERMDAGLCDAVTGRRDSAAMLRALEDANLFVVSLDELGGSYRYHQLFRELLRHQLRLHDPERERSIQLAAAACAELEGHAAEAASYYIAAGDAESSLRALSAHFERGFSAAPEGGQLGWLRTVDEDLVARSPDRMITYALGLLAEGRADAATDWLARAESELYEGHEDLATEDRLRHAWIACHEIRGDVDASLTEALRLRAVATARDDDSSLVRAFASVVRAHAALGEDDAARIAYASIPPARGVPSRLRGVLLPGVYACVASRRGHLSEANQLAEQALRGADGDTDSDSVDLIDPWIALAWVHLERNELVDAEAAGRRALRLARRGYRVAGEVQARIALSWVLFARGQFAEVLDLLATAHPERAAEPLAQHLGDQVRTADAWLWLRFGDIERAQRLLEQLVIAPAQRWLAARVDLARGRPDLALVTLDELRSSPLPLAAEVTARVLTARAFGRHDLTAATAELQEAVALARPEGFVRTFVDEGPEVTRLLRRLAGADHSAYIATLVAAGEQPHHPAAALSLELVEPLSEREQEVLRYLPTRLNNQEVAGELYVSLNTVKTHLKSIYRKLDAGSRSEAVVKARAMQLL
jgi:LuxR family maltose regulon positive regulatory protein